MAGSDRFDVLPLADYGLLDARSLPRRTRDRHLRSGELRWVGRGLLAGPPADDVAAWWQDLAIAVAQSWPDVAVCGAAAAALYGLDSFEAGKVPITVTAQRQRHAQGRTMHRPTWEPDIRQVDGIPFPVTAPADTILALAGQRDLAMPWLTRIERIELAFESAAFKNLLSHADLVEAIERAPRNLGGRTWLREFAVLRPAELVPTESYLETRFVQVARRYGIVEIRRQVWMYDRRGRIGRVDFVFRGVVIECDSLEYHNNPVSFQADRVRRSRLLAVGHPMIEVTKRRLENDADALIAEIHAATRLVEAGGAAARARFDSGTRGPRNRQKTA